MIVLLLRWLAIGERERSSSSKVCAWICCPGLAQEAVEDSASPHEHAEDHQKANRHVAASRNHIADGLDGVVRMVMIIASAPGSRLVAVALGGSLCNRPSVHDAHIVAAHRQHGLLFLLAQCGGHALGHARHGAREDTAAPGRARARSEECEITCVKECAWKRSVSESSKLRLRVVCLKD